MSNNEEFIGIAGRTTMKIEVPEGIITLRNCGPSKAFFNVSFKANSVPKKKVVRVAGSAPAASGFQNRHSTS